MFVPLDIIVAPDMRVPRPVSELMFVLTVPLLVLML
jgi:hypothetical protein